MMDNMKDSLEEFAEKLGTDEDSGCYMSRLTTFLARHLILVYVFSVVMAYLYAYSKHVENLFSVRVIAGSLITAIILVLLLAVFLFLLLIMESISKHLASLICFGRVYDGVSMYGPDLYISMLFDDLENSD